MRYDFDEEAGKLTVTDGDSTSTIDLWSPEAFSHLGRLWVRVGWQAKYMYTFSWFGRPVIQLPEDLITLQEQIWETKPTVIIETGIAHGGSLVFHAGVLQALGGGRVIGIDIEVRDHNQKAIDEHPLKSMIDIVIGSSTDPAIVSQVANMITPDDRVMVILDSNHTYAHVRDELSAYAPLVTKGQWMVATDGVMNTVHDVPRAGANWDTDNPSRAAIEFAEAHSEFELVDPVPPVFDESDGVSRPTHWPAAWLRRK
jgi:cephalosporin hydroxylase